MKINWEPEVLTYENIRNIADDFLKKYNPENKIPIEIESIAEFNLDITITPLPKIKLLLDADSLISNDLKEIYIDDTIYDFEQRARFSIAHELGHAILHGGLYKKINFNSIEEWKELQRNFHSESYKWCEVQARNFAGLILVPQNHLITYFEQAKEILIAQGFSDFEQTNNDLLIE
jgi:Zn-dependent peptidase ImmA (M78 family)